MEAVILDRLTVLGHPGRMAVFRLLMRRLPDDVPAGEIGRALGVKPSTLSVYLSALAQAGLVGQRRQGTSLLYRAEVSAVGDIMEFLLEDCCRGRPGLCPPLPSPSVTGRRAVPDRKYNVLFICSGNSARSIFAESILRDMAGDRFEAHSAGTRPYSELNPFAVKVLEDKGHDVSLLRAKNVSEFQRPDAPEMDFVFTVCDQAANEECPPWPGQPISAHWGMPDPVKVEGTEAEKALAFQQAYGALRNRLLAFTALPIDQLDRISLQKAVDDLARSDAGEPA
ncbi:ArsR family transcriptional regulator [Rhodosalinus halophilus]|uniref:ArsR family transcriptional regulator n=1 Tax=Rhodosalinus halophilus TaxID=2259333 RepID=A0A365U9J8_9RHOB|nr:helix-turn-helix domain-containing protein [Rhodosalinus halophilus]RBI85411.1 ArsR family transcriptional regulator [Rhodosalinus halophilus]